jgi:hypothetical protein
VKKRLTVFAFVLLLAAGAVAQSQSATSPSKVSKPSKLVVTLRIDQGVTARHPHPPAGDKGDIFSVDLTLFTIKNEFDAAPNTRVGKMSFSYLLRGTCSVSGNGCKGTVDITTLSKLPGGTIRAVANKIPIRQPFVVKITGGTGKYAGATGNIVIAPDGAARNIYRIVLP